MKMTYKHIFTGLMIICMLLFLECGLIFNTSSVVEINLGSGPVAPSGDSFKPGTVTGGTLTVDIPDEAPIVKDFGAKDDTIKMVVPSGRNRKIELEINLNTDSVQNPGPLLSFIGTAFVDLVPNETKRVHLKMIPGRTRLLVPDYYGHRVIQMDFLGSGITGEYPLPTAPDTTIWASDIDMDSRGRIYMGYKTVSVPPPVYTEYLIIRLNGIEDTSPVLIKTAARAEAIAIDKKNNLLYYYSSALSTSVSRIDLDQNPDLPIVEDFLNMSAEGLSIPNGLMTEGLDTDVEGNIYFTTEDSVVKINPFRPEGSRVTGTYSNFTILNAPYDVVVKDEFVFVSNASGTSGNMIIKLRRSDLGLVGNAGSKYNTTPPSTSGMFYGPKRFVSITNKRLHLIDEGSWGSPTSPAYEDQLIGFNDIDDWSKNWDSITVSALFFDNH